MPKKGQAKDAKSRIANFRNRLTQQGLKRVEVVVPADQVPLLRMLGAAIRNGSYISVSPPAMNGGIAGNKKENPMQVVETPWSVTSLKAALEETDIVIPGEFTIAISEGADRVLEVEVSGAGGLIVYLAVEGEQIISTTVLWSRDEQEEPEAFEAMMLRSHKVFMPLCSLGIDLVDGKEYYELFGAMSARSALASVVTEIRTIANNALELAQELGPNQQDSAA